MPIDPLSALSVAASIVQFAEFAGKIVSKGKELYSSTSGALRENEETESATERLQLLALQTKDAWNHARRSTVRSLPPQGPVLLVAGENENAEDLLIRQNEQRQEREEYLREEKEQQEIQRRLEDICGACDRISTELLKHLRELKVPKGQEHREWRSFRHALKSVWSKKGVDEMARKLSELRSDMDTHVLVLLRQKVQTLSIAQDRRFLKLNTDIKNVIKSLLEAKLTHTEELEKHFEALTLSQKSEHAETRATFIYMEREKRKTMVQLSLLESLRFPMMNDRYEKLARAHEKTFTWIFNDPERHQKPWDNFSDWLSDGSGTYWIQGKAASGKSTLMRFIWNHPSTKEQLRHWAGTEESVNAAFFFWNSGTPDQRSQSGLLRSLLYEVLKKRTDLIPIVISEQWEKVSTLVSHDLQITPVEWSLDNLQCAFETLVETAGLTVSPSLKLCFFIDGLDEYDGDPEDISQFFLNLSRLSPHIKFCVSSRPWPVFLDIYEGIPGLRLQDLTQDDIVLYIHDKLGKSKQMRWFDPQSTTKLVRDIVKRADGVFLWVVLVVKSLVNGLRNGDNISHLERRLASLPPGLEELYGHMLESIDPLDREEASQIFQIFRTNGHYLDVPTLERALRSPGYSHAIDMPSRTTAHCTDQEIKGIQMGIERMTMRVNSRSKGLLEVPHTENQYTPQAEVSQSQTSLPVVAKVWFNSWVACSPDIDVVENVSRQNVYGSDEVKAPEAVNPFLEYSRLAAKRVPMRLSDILDRPDSDDASTEELDEDLRSDFLQISYLHRTVREYLEQEHIWNNLLSSTAGTDFDPRSALLAADVVELKTFDEQVSYSSSVYDVGIEAATRVGRLAPLNATEHVVLLEELGRVISARWVGGRIRKATTRSSRTQENDFQFQDLDRQGDIYDILSTIMMSLLRWYVDTKLVAACSPTPSRPSPCLLAFALGLELWCVSETVKRAPVPDYKVAETLLRLGCDPNAPFKGSSVWGYTISFLHIQKDIKDTEELRLSRLFPWIRLCKLFLEHGADPNMCCVKGYHNWWLEAQPGPVQETNHSIFNPKKLTNIKTSGREAWQDVEVGTATAKSKCSEIFCSVADVFEDVFMKPKIEGCGELLSFLKSKMRSSSEILANSQDNNQKKKNRKKKGRARGS